MPNKTKKGIHTPESKLSTSMTYSYYCSACDLYFTPVVNHYGEMRLIAPDQPIHCPTCGRKLSDATRKINGFTAEQDLIDWLDNILTRMEDASNRMGVTLKYLDARADLQGDSQ